jgi:hypothetical protein
VGALEQHAEADAFDLADAQSVAGLEQTPGRCLCGFVRFALNTAGCHRG